MGLFKKLSTLFSGSSTQAERDVLWVTVRCNRCGEIIRARVNLNNDLSVVYDDEGTKYYCRKQLIGEGNGELPCFQRIEVELTFDEKRNVIAREISGGQFVVAGEPSESQTHIRVPGGERTPNELPGKKPKKASGDVRTGPHLRILYSRLNTTQDRKSFIDNLAKGASGSEVVIYNLTDRMTEQLWKTSLQDLFRTWLEEFGQKKTAVTGFVRYFDPDTAAANTAVYVKGAFSIDVCRMLAAYVLSYRNEVETGVPAFPPGGNSPQLAKTIETLKGLEALWSLQDIETFNTSKHGIYYGSYEAGELKSLVGVENFR